jgi:hypothetical protein
MAARQPKDSDGDIPLFGPRLPLEVVPLILLPVIMVVAPLVPPVPTPDSDSDNEGRYRDIDDTVIEVGKPMQEARPSAMQVTNAHADRSANLSCSLKFQPTIEWMVLYFCRLDEQVLQLLRAKLRSLELNHLTPINDSSVVPVIRAAMYSRLSIVDCCGTNLAIFPNDVPTSSTDIGQFSALYHCANHQIYPQFFGHFYRINTALVRHFYRINTAFILNQYCITTTFLLH